MNTNVIRLTIVGVFTTVLLFVGIGAIIVSRVTEYPTHYHANFAVFVRGAQVNFAKPDLMHLKPCKADDDPALHPKLENIHLHDMVGNIVHIHDDGLIWNDLFASIRYNLKDESQKNNAPIYYYINGSRVDESILTTLIGKNDRLLVTMSTEPLPSSVDGSLFLQSQIDTVGNNAGDYDTQSTESCSGNKARTWPNRLRIGLIRIF